MLRNKLILIIGCVGSGKTFFSKKLEEESGATRISSDELRAIFGKDESDQSVSGQVFAHIKREIARLLLAKTDVILDATNTTIKSRSDFIKIAREAGATTVAYFINTPIEVAKKRNSQRQRIVPEFVINNQFSKLTPPTPQEFDEIHEIKN